MRILLDTNVLIAAFISHGVCAELLEYCAYHHDLISSDFILKEFRENLAIKFKISIRESSEATQLLATRMNIVKPLELDSKTCRDQDDDRILGTAIAGQCQCVITGDKDLLVLKKYKGVDIISPQDFWKYEA
jgi:putative PIN family toxin of toxin-antitoxin system